MLYKNCLRCGRKLKTLESKEKGFGKICFEKWQEEIKSKKLFEVKNEKSV